MRKKIYFVTRTWLPSKTGGSIIRQKQVALLKKANYEVIIVTPKYENLDSTVTNQIVQLSYKFRKYNSIFQRIGYYEDYLDNWVKKTFNILKNNIRSEDIIFSTTGGELASIKLGSLLKEYSMCSFVVNYHDPISYTLVNGLKVDDKFHVSREQLEYKYIQNADIISTSSRTIQQNIINKFPNLIEKVINNYFGYIENINISNYTQRDENNMIIGYGGSFTTTQRPEILSIAYERVKDQGDIQISYIGNYSKYEPIKKYKDAMFNGPFAHEEFIKFMIENIDIGFVSLQNDYFGACVPSKIYEYLNLGLPILAALPNGDAKNLIEDNGFGLCYKYDDYEGIARGIERFYIDKDFYNNCRNNILKEKEKWSMESLFSEFIDKIKKL